MRPEIIGVFVPIIALIGFFGVMGLKIWSSHRLKMRELPAGDGERLTETVQQLCDDFGSMREDVAELHERVEFTERMLAEVRSRTAIGPGDAT